MLRVLTQPPLPELKARCRLWCSRGKGTRPFPSQQTLFHKPGLGLSVHPTPLGIKVSWAGGRASGTTRGPGAFKKILRLPHRGRPPFPTPSRWWLGPAPLQSVLPNSSLWWSWALDEQVGEAGSSRETVLSPGGREWSPLSGRLNLLLPAPPAQGPEPTPRSPRRQC